MKKRAVGRAIGMALVSALLCAAVAALPQPPQETEAEEAPVPVLQPDVEDIRYDAQEPVGIARVTGVQDTLVPASDYGQLLPYAAQIAGWEQDGTPVYRYAFADSAGELVTNPVYTSVERMSCQKQLIWLMTRETEDGTRVSCAAHDGSWILGPFDGSIVVNESCIFVKRADSSVTTVYGSDGKIIGQVRGTVSSCTDGVIVSREDTENGTVWHLSDAETTDSLAMLAAAQVGAFSGGAATVQLTETAWGFVDERGEVTPVDAVWLDECCDGYALAQDAAGQYGVLSASGGEAAPFAYSSGTHCGDELPLYQLWESEEDCIVLSAATGQKLMLPKDLNGGRVTALPESYFAYVDEDGNAVVFDDLERFSFEGEASFYRQGGEWMIVCLEDGYQIFDLDEAEAGKLQPYAYTAPQQQAAYADTVFTVTDPETGLQGIGNTRGRIVLAPQYDSIFSVDGSYFAAVSGCWSGIVDANGEWIVRTLLTGAH